MSYCTVEDLRVLLPKNITIGTETVTTPTLQPNLPGINNSAVIQLRDAEDAIKKGAETIDGTLRPVYVCPLKRMKVYETDLVSNASTGDDSITVRDHAPFSINSLIRISDNNNTELHYVGSYEEPQRNVSNFGVVPLANTLGVNFTLSNSARVSLLEFPDPIPVTCARLAVGLLFDRLFVAEQQPDVSSYGKTQRNLAMQDLDRILAGYTRLEGQNHTGSRFARTSVMNSWGTPGRTERFQPGQFRE